MGNSPSSQLIKVMELNPSSEAANCAALQELSNILRNPKVHYRVHKSLRLVPILSQTIPVHTRPTYLRQIHFNIAHPPTSWSSQWSLSFWLSPLSPICVPLLPHSCYMLCPYHPLRLDHSSCTWRRVQVMKLLIMQCSQTPSIYVPAATSETKFHTHTEPQAKLEFCVP
jgi:hypothetical protein